MTVDVVMFTMDARIDRRILLAARTLMANGLRVHLFAPAYAGFGEEPDWIQRIDIQSAGAGGKGLNLYRLVTDRWPWLRGAFRWLVWRATPSPEHVFVTLFAPVLERAAARVYIAHDLPMLPVAIAARGHHGGRILLDSHELYPEQEFSDWEKRLWRKVETRLIGQADAIITVNPSIAREISRRHGLPEPTVVQNAELYRKVQSNRDRSRLRQALGIPASAKVFLYQGGLSARRNIETLIAAFGRVRNKDAMLVILGDGAVLAGLQRLAHIHGLADRVRFHPAVPQAELLEMTQGADFGVIPYEANCLNTELCTPNKLFEFIMARIPIISTDLLEIRRIVAGYNIGLLGNTETPESFAQLIDDAIDRTTELEPSWRSGLERAAHDLCWEREGETYLSVVRDLANPVSKTTGP
ncbi:glycosyltransferase [Bradyrhizobium mercantei]|uniref:glycosyltransferase n=1 Tax=Bradyrhizobium mercantei TaxID=1904807 RepID=UPI000975A130|nr:glycosyltransferase [Bradyrhizobium mercantei]